MSKHQAMLDFLKQFPPLTNEYLNFNFLENADGSQSLLTMQQDTPRRDILGNRIGTYDFAISLIRGISETTDSVNVKTMDSIDLWIDWIEEQNYERNLPDFGEGFSVESIENLSTMGDLAQVYENGTGKYLIMCRVNYLKEGA